MYTVTLGSFPSVVLANVTGAPLHFSVVPSAMAAANSTMAVSAPEGAAAGAPVSVAGPVAPGRYRVEVRWQPGDAFVPSGEVFLQQGATTTISCKRAFFRCKA